MTPADDTSSTRPYTVWLPPALVARAIAIAKRDQPASVPVYLGPLVEEALALWLAQTEAGEAAEGPPRRGPP